MNAPEPAPAVLHSVPTARILKSPTNPRKRRNAMADAELAESVKAHGILQPLLVRPWAPGMTLPQGACFGDMADHFELIAGERRWTAAQAAGLAAVPVLVHDLPDDAVLELQLVENIQREDLHPLEEAEGYEALMTRHGYTVEQIADKTHRSKSAIYASLKLTALCPQAREAFYAGHLTASTALLIARIPVEKLQTQALEDIAGSERQDPTPFREAARVMQSRYMLRLADAPFSRADEDLVPGAGRCHACPKRTGNQAEFFADVKSADVCTDPDCFAAKKLAHAERQRAQALAEGRKVIEGAAAKKVMPHAYGGDLAGGYVALDQTCYDDPKRRTVRQILGNDAPPPDLLVSPHDKGKTVEVVSRASIEEHLKAKGIDAPRSATGHRSEAEKKAEQKRRQEGLFRVRLFEQLRSAYTEAQNSGLMDLDTDDLRLIAGHLLPLMGFDDAKRLARYWIGAGEGDDRAIIRRLQARVAEMGVPEVSRLLLECCLVGQVTVSAWSDSKPEHLLRQAEFMGLDPKAIKAGIIAEQRAREKAKQAPKGKEKATPAGAEKAPARAPGELRIGERVRVNDKVKAQGGHLRKCAGREGTVEAIEDPFVHVRFSPKVHDIVTNLKAEELEVLPAETASPPTPAAPTAASSAAPAAPAKGKPGGKRAAGKPGEEQDPAAAPPPNEPAAPAKPAKPELAASLIYCHPENGPHERAAEGGPLDAVVGPRTRRK